MKLLGLGSTRFQVRLSQPQAGGAEFQGEQAALPAKAAPPLEKEQPASDPTRSPSKGTEIEFQFARACVVAQKGEYFNTTTNKNT